mgnify:FL=1
MSRKTRSQAYQYKFAEIATTGEFLESFSNSSSLGSSLNPFHYDEKVLELEDKLKEKIFLLCESILTENQKNIFKLTRSGLTQIEIAKKLNINQSSVTKCLYGNIDYTHGKPRVYGGCLQKIKKYISKNIEIQELLNELLELREEIL